MNRQLQPKVLPITWVAAIEKLPGRLAGSRILHQIGSLLTHRRLIHYAIVSIVFQLLFYGSWMAMGDFPYDATGYPVGADLSSFLIGAQVVHDGETSHLYEPEFQLAVQKTMLSDINQDNYLYYVLPPLVAYALVPLTLLPYISALVLWTLLMSIVLVVGFWVLWPALPRLHHYRVRNLAFIASATFVFADALYSGQMTALWLLMLVGSLRLFQSDKELPAGALLGIGLLKPQLFFLFPVLLLVQRRYAALAALVGTAATLATINVTIVGPGVVGDYLRLLDSDRYFEWNADLITWKMTTLIGLFRFATGMATSQSLTSTALTLGLAATGAIVVWYVARPQSPGVAAMPFDVQFALTLFATFAFAPHVLTYDGIILIAAGSILLNHFPDSALVKTMLFLSALLAVTMFVRVVMFLPAPTPLNLLAAPWYPVFFVLLLIGVKAEATRQVPVPNSPIAHGSVTGPALASSCPTRD